MAARELVIAAGGTGGHIIPGIQIGRSLERLHGERFHAVYYCGCRPIEQEIYKGEGIEPVRVSIGASPFRSSPVARTLRIVWDTVRLMVRFLRRRPAAVLAMGGEVCFPALVAARVLFIPIFLHESNRIPGRVVRMFHKSARSVFLGMDGFTGANAVHTGTPSRAQPASEAGDRGVLLCVGGSQGAARLNEIFLAAANSSRVRAFGLRTVLIAGPGKLPADPGTVEVREYEPNLPGLMAQTRLAVSRSGSGSLADLASNRVPSILVPYPFAKDGHQQANAEWFTTRGAAVLIEEKVLTAAFLEDALCDLLQSEERLSAMRGRLMELDTPRAADMIAGIVVRQLAGHSGAAPSPIERQPTHEHL